jgi:hypothetical protein
MRALVGAIITAGAMIGLGLTAIGIGNRYQSELAFQHMAVGPDAPKSATQADDPQPRIVRMSSMDRPLVFCLVFATSVAVIGLGITLFGLAYHHLRREREYQLERDRGVVPRTTP